jgi:hypothetical protein
MDQKRRTPCCQPSHQGARSRSQALRGRTSPGQVKRAQGTRRWLWRLADFANPLRDACLVIASLLTLLEVAGQNESWYGMLGLALINLLVVRLIVWSTTTAVLYSLVLLHKAWRRSASGQTHMRPSR